MSRELAESAFRRALELHQRGQLRAAIDAYRESLAANPEHAYACNYLGVAEHQSGDLAAARTSLERSARLAPTNPGCLTNLANLYKDVGDLALASSAYQRALSLAPGFVPARFGLAQIAERQGKWHEAAMVYGGLAEHPEARYRLAVLALDESPQSALGFVEGLPEESRPSMAQLWLDRLIAQLQTLEPSDLDGIISSALAVAEPEVSERAAVLLYRSGRVVETRALLERSLARFPGDDRLTTTWLRFCAELGVPAEGMAALTGSPDLLRNADLTIAAASVIAENGEVDRAIRMIEEALRKETGRADLVSYLNQLMLCSPGCGAADQLAAAQRFGNLARQLAAGDQEKQPSRANRRGGSGRIRLAVLSTDFCVSPVGRFMDGFVRHLDTERFELLVFSDRPLIDDWISRGWRHQAAHFSDCGGWQDDRLAQEIQRQHPDVLLELAGHVRGNRLAMLAHRLAPVQASFLGYVATTGVSAIDCRIADWHTEPQGAEAFSTERLIRMPGSYFCMPSPAGLPPISALPALSRGAITFGCFAQRVKISDECLRHWLSVIDAIPNSRMVVGCRIFGQDRLAPAEFLQRIEKLGGDPARFVLRGWKSAESHLSQYEDIDIGLNTWPFQLATNACDALMMGVPMLDVQGAEHRNRLGKSIVSAAGHPEWSCADQASLVETARSLSRDLGRLARLRQQLRSEVTASDLCDAPSFSTRLSDVLRSIA